MCSEPSWIFSLKPVGWDYPFNFPYCVGRKAFHLLLGNKATLVSLLITCTYVKKSNPTANRLSVLWHINSVHLDID